MKKNYYLPIPNIPKELKLMLTLMRGKLGNGQPLLNEKDFEGIDWSSFQDYVKHHRLFPSVYKGLKQYEAEGIPPHVMQSVTKEYRTNIYRMLFLTGETEHVSRFFAEAKIDTLFLKGPALAFHLYGDISFRTSSDLDIFIPIDKLERAEQLLISQGYVKDDYFDTVLTNWKWRHHHLAFNHPQRRIKLELHWRLNPGPSLEPSFKELWERRNVLNLTSQNINILGNEDLFLFLVTHGARHGWSRLRWLEDIALMTLKKIELDWVKVHSLLRKYQCTQIGGQALILASEIFGIFISKEMEPILKGNKPRKLAEKALFYIEHMVNLHTVPVPKEISNYHRQYMFSTMSARQKLLFLLSFLHPYPEDAEVLPLPEKLHFLYFPLRPILWIWRKTRRKVVA